MNEDHADAGGCVEQALGTAVTTATFRHVDRFGCEYVARTGDELAVVRLAFSTPRRAPPTCAASSSSSSRGLAGVRRSVVLALAAVVAAAAATTSRRRPAPRRRWQRP